MLYIYPKGDMRKLLAILASIDTPHGRTLVQIVAVTGVDKRSVYRLIMQAIEQLGAEIYKDGASYTLTNPGPLLVRSHLPLVLQGKVGTPVMGVPSLPTPRARKRVTPNPASTPSKRSATRVSKKALARDGAAAV